MVEADLQAGQCQRPGRKPSVQQQFFVYASFLCKGMKLFTQKDMKQWLWARRQFVWDCVGLSGSQIA